MPLITLNLSISLALNPAKTAIILTDTTGLYNATFNPFGYGSPSGIAVNDVTGLIITLNYTSIGASAIYTFTVVNGTITAATITFTPLSAETILAQLQSTVFPFVAANPFTFFNSYIRPSTAVYILPDITLGAYTVSYNIIGTASATPFDLTTEGIVLQELEAQCCIDEIFNKSELNCGCENKDIEALRAQSYIDIARLASEIPDTTRANLYLNKAFQLCNCGCGCS